MRTQSGARSVQGAQLATIRSEWSMDKRPDGNIRSFGPGILYGRHRPVPLRGPVEEETSATVSQRNAASPRDLRVTGLRSEIRDLHRLPRAE